MSASRYGIPEEAWPNDPNGSLAPILAASLEAAMTRHPSASGDSPGAVLLTAADRCDRCPAAAGYRLQLRDKILEMDLCVHHWRKHYPKMCEQGWGIVGANPHINKMVEEAGPS